MTDETKLKEKLAKYEKKYGPLIETRGLHNWKNLFRKPTASEWLILIMLAMMLFLAWAYQHDIKTCQEYIQKDIDTYNMIQNGTIPIENQTQTTDWNFSLINE